MITRRTLLGTAALLAGAASASAQTTPPRGSTLRTDLMNALRPTIQAQIGGPVEFVVRALRVMDPWAYMDVLPQRPGGGNIDWDRTKFREDMRQGHMGDSIMALLRRSGSRWTVVEYVIGPSDVAWYGWRQDRRLPRTLFTDE